MSQTKCFKQSEYDNVFQLSFQCPFIGTEKWYYQIVCSIVNFSIWFVSMAYSSSADSIMGPTYVHFYFIHYIISGVVE